jgi:hypothetical protein
MTPAELYELRLRREYTAKALEREVKIRPLGHTARILKAEVRKMDAILDKEEKAS